jgi:hypothetical protein
MNVENIVADADDSRTNIQIESAVNRGLVVSMLRGVSTAAVFMRTAAVPMQVILRVLGDPGRRRASDWQQNGVTSPLLGDQK